ncbi:hypothetical protein [Sphingobacterium suaedae]|uniref:DUF4296 domain-containing protein n=1 Tax=Sphingobacterium suaedae TaxID=1686402 RepID=A0ABW5KMZ5_9SPHI
MNIWGYIVQSRKRIVIWKIVALLMTPMLHGCFSSEVSSERQEAALRELVLLRTEGLALAEFIGTKSTKPEVLSLCDTIRRYYQHTHPEFLRICAGRKITLVPADFEHLWNAMLARFDTSQLPLEQLSLRLCEENLRASIGMYESILREQEWEDICYFSFIALPDLYTQRDALSSLRRQVEATSSPSN